MRRAGVIASLAVVFVIAAIGGYLLFRGDSDAPAPVGLSDPAPAAGSAGTQSGADGTTDGTTDGTADGTADGTWQVVQGDNTFVGYRVQERLAFLDAPNQAIGRSPAVQGTMNVQGDQVTAANVKADLTQLASNENRRDNAIRNSGLESVNFPEATFVLSPPMKLSGAPAQGQTVKGDASGRLTIHGQTRDVTIPLQGRWDGASAEVAGSLGINMPDYGITPPKLGPVQAIQDQAIIELRLTFKKS